MFRRSSLCLQHVVLNLPEVRVRSASVAENGPDLSEVIEPVQCF